MLDYTLHGGPFPYEKAAQLYRDLPHTSLSVSSATHAAQDSGTMVMANERVPEHGPESGPRLLTESEFRNALPEFDREVLRRRAVKSVIPTLERMISTRLTAEQVVEFTNARAKLEFAQSQYRSAQLRLADAIVDSMR